jgi:autotransporter-associated beta strand protein
MLLLSLACQPVTAAIRTWDGDASANNNWSVSGNWAEGSAPVNGDVVIFPAGLPAADLLTTNNIVGLRLDLIQFSGAGGGYFVRGNSLILSNGITAAQSLGNNTVDLDLTLGRAQTFLVSDAQGVLTVNGDIALNGFDLTVNAAGTNNLNGVISGTGDITKIGTGRLVLGGINASPNTYVGDTRLNAGTLQLSRFTIIAVIPDLIIQGRVSVPGNLFVGDGAGADLVIESSENQIADTATVAIADTATFQLDNVSDAIAALTMNGGTVTTGTGTLTNGNITTTASAVIATISGNLHLGSFTRTFNVADGGASPDLDINASIGGGSSGVFPTITFAGITKTGTGTLNLDGNNTYSGTTVVDGGFVQAGSDTAFGNLVGTVVVNPAGQLILVGADIGNKNLIVNRPDPLVAMSSVGASSWGGSITLNSNAVFTTGGTLALSNSVTGPGDLIFQSTLAAALFRLAGATANTFAGDVLVRDGTLELAKTAGIAAIPHNLTIGESGDSATSKFTRHINANQIANAGNVTINCNSQLDLNNNSDTISSLTMAGGTVTTGTGTLVVNGNITVEAGLAPCGDNFINGELSFSGAGPRFISLPVAALALGAPDLFINAAILASPELRITGNSGRVFLNGANTFAGLLRLESTSGDLIVRLNNPSALGGIAAGTVLDGVQLELGGFVFADEPLTNVNAGTLIRTFGNNNHGGPIVLNADLFVTNTAAITEFAGAITGANFDVTKTGTGTLRFSGAGANTFGTMFVNQGLFEMNKNASVNAASPLIVGDGVNSATARHFQSSQTDDVTINFSSLWDLNGNNDAINSLTLADGGDVTTDAGTLSFGAFGSITVTGGPFGLFGTASFISGNLNLGTSGTRTISVVERAPFALLTDSTELIISAIISGTSGFIKTGAGDMSLSGANTFTGAVTVNDGEVLISHDTALGTAAGGVSVNGDAVLQVSGDISVGAEVLTLNSTGQNSLFESVGALHSAGGSNSWAGNITLQQTARISVVTNSHLNLLGILSGPGGVTKEQPGTLLYSGAGVNTYLGVTTVEAGTLELRKTGVDDAIPGDLIIGDGNGGALSDVVRVVGVPQIATACDITMSSSGLLDLNGVGEGISTLAGSGRVDLGAAGTGGLTLNGNGSTEYSGLIVGTGLPSAALIKRGTGTFILAANNTYTGTNRVEAGTLLVDGSQPNSDVLVLTSGTLGGTGVVGDLKVNNIGNLAPGTSPGQLETRNTKLDPASNFRVEINGSTAGLSHDTLNVVGTIDLNGALLLPTKSPGYAPVDGTLHTIIFNNGVDAVTGAFGGMPEGSIVSLNGIDFRLSYVGGTGNDVTLTVTNIPLAFASTRVEAGNGNGRADPNECDHLFVALENRGPGPISGITARLDSLTTGVSITQPDSAYPNIPALGFGTNTTAFQIRISPDWVCGLNIRLSLVVSATGEGTFAVPFTLNSGAPGTFFAFGSTNVPKAILDLDTTNSLINVTNQFVIRKARVSVHATHPAAGDLRFRLRSPAGLEVLLSANRGGNVANYGNSCSPAAARTTFDDDAATKITAASAPFVGTFAPEENLATLIGQNSFGTWRLFVDDTVPGDTGTLQCWSLSLAVGDCPDGGGECESCLTTVSGTLTGASPLLAERISRTGNPGGCGNIKLCPLPTPLGAPFRYSTHLFTNNGPATCVTVVLYVPCADSTNELQSAAYLTTFNPADICENYLGDSGNSVAGGSGGYSFRVAAGARFVVVVNEINAVDAVSGCPNYSLQLYGLPCPPPVLHISHVETPPNRVRLFWSTAYPLFQLQRSASLNGAPPFPFVSVPGAPFVIGGDYNVTNSATANDDYFRLRRP